MGWTRRNLLLVRALPHRPTPGCPPSGGGVRGGGLGETYYLSALFRNTPGPGCPPSGGGARAGWARRRQRPDRGLKSAVFSKIVGGRNSEAMAQTQLTQQKKPLENM